MQLFSLVRLCTVVSLISAMPLSALAALKVTLEKSSMTASFKQMNVPMEGIFKKFNASIDFNPAKLDASKAEIDIDMNGFDLGDADFNKEVAKKTWFNSAQFPKASFSSTSIKSSGAGKYEVAGKLTIKGKTTEVSIPVSVKKEGALQIFDGILPIKRLTYAIGEGEWKDTSMVADEVVLKFHLVTSP